MLTKETVDRIRRMRGNSFPVLSVYLNLGLDGRESASVGARLRDMLKPIRASCASLDHRAATSLRRDIDEVMDLEKRMASEIGHGVAVFSCAGAGFFEYLSLPRKLWDVAVADAKPYTRPLDALLDEFHRYCAVVVDRRRSRIYEFYMGELEAWHETVEEGRLRSNFGGWYGLAEYGARNHAEEVAHRHYRETARLIGELFEERGFDILLLGGHKGSVDEFKPFLPCWLADLVAGSFVVDPHSATPATITEHCTRLEEAYERSLERNVVDELFGRTHTHLTSVGLAHTLDAANARAIDVLLVDAGRVAEGVACSACAWLGLFEPVCPFCRADTRAVTDIIDHIARRAVEDGAAVEHVFGDTALRGHRVGALLRFPAPGTAARGT
jgi:peptide chain release factor subunit 1